MLCNPQRSPCILALWAVACADTELAQQRDTQALDLGLADGRVSGLGTDLASGCIAASGAAVIQPVEVHTSAPEAGNWKLALLPEQRYRELTVSVGPGVTVAWVDDPRPTAEVAAVLLSRPVRHASAAEEMRALIATLRANPPLGATLRLRSAGTRAVTHDAFDTSRQALLDLQLSVDNAISPASLRPAVLASLLATTPDRLGTLPAGFGVPTTTLRLRLTVVRRDRRTLILALLTSSTHDEARERLTGIVADDLANGSALATAFDRLEDACDVRRIERKPSADIIWVIDESGSIGNDRLNIKANAEAFFARALAAGLDFRVAVTGTVAEDGVVGPLTGVFCPLALAGEDRFLLSSERGLFEACVTVPDAHQDGSEYGLISARAAIERHLPRKADSPRHLRPDAVVAVIVVSDELPASLQDRRFEQRQQCALPAAQSAELNRLLRPYIDFFRGQPVADTRATVHVVGGTCASACGADVAHGYRDLATALGGQVADICQEDFAVSLRSIVDGIVARASPVVLHYTPVSSSLALSLQGQRLPRSRHGGFDYRGVNNSVVFLGVEYDAGDRVALSYKRWQRQRVK